MADFNKGDYIYLKMSDGFTYTGVFDCAEEKFGVNILWMWYQGKRSMFNTLHLVDCGRA